MFGFFKKKTVLEKLNEQYELLLKQSYELSTINRTASDEKVAEANKLLEKIKELETKN